MIALLMLQQLAPLGLGQSRNGPQHADADCGIADAADTAAGRDDVHHAVPADHDRAALSAPGAGHANDALESGTDRAGAVSHDRDHAAGRAGHLHQRVVAAGTGEITAQTAMDRGSAPLKTFLAKFVREKDVRLFVEIAKAPAPRTPSDLDLQRPDSRVHTFRAENRIPDRRRSVSAVSDHRSRRRVGHADHRHGPTAAGHDFGAIQDPVVRARRRLESCGRIAVEELLLR